MVGCRFEILIIFLLVTINGGRGDVGTRALNTEWGGGGAPGAGGGGLVSERILMPEGACL